MPTLSSPLQAVALLAAIPVMVALAIIAIGYLLVAVSGIVSFAARIRRAHPRLARWTRCPTCSSDLGRPRDRLRARCLIGADVRALARCWPRRRCILRKGFAPVSTARPGLCKEWPLGP
ncbi:MAG: hypothetical protein ACRDS9_00715 [Pseudonocardiaceae bacterium]